MSDNLTAIVTGGVSGLGLAATKRFLSKGYRVAVVDLDEAKGRELELRYADRSQLKFYKTDVTDRDAAHDLADKVAQDFGRIDILVNAAGIIRRTPCKEVEEAELMGLLQVNLAGTVWMCQAVQVHMAKAGSGAICNFCSMLAHYGSENLLSYAASKGGVMQVSKSMAVSWAKHGIRVNTVSPGYIETKLSAGATQDPVFRERILSRTPQGRYGKPEEVAAAIDFLCSPDASFITGADLPIDGGLLAGDPALYPPARN